LDINRGFLGYAHVGPTSCSGLGICLG
jgi:hypothetical protein